MGRRLSIIGILAILVGAFLLLDGIEGVRHANSLFGRIGGAFNQGGRTVTIIVSVVEILAGGLLVLAQFMSIGSLDGPLRVGIFIAWIGVMVFALLINNFQPGAIGWWRSLAQYSIVLGVIWMLRGERA